MTILPQGDPLPFTPVPGRVRHDGWTPERQRLFLTALAEIGVVTTAARATGVSARSAYRLLARAGPDSGFARAWAAALERPYRIALEHGLERGVHGEEVPVFYGGRQVGRYRRHDDRLTLAVLRAVAARGRREASVPAPTDRRDTAAAFHSALRALASSESGDVLQDS